MHTDNRSAGRWLDESSSARETRRRLAMGRSAFLRLSSAACAGWLVSDWLGSAEWPRSAQAQQGADERRKRIGSVIAQYDAQGIHRTATETDNESGRWLADLAHQAGADAALEPFPLARVDVRAAYVEVAGRRIEGIPLFDGAFTDDRGVAGRLGMPGVVTDGSRGGIALTAVDQAGISSQGQSIAELRRNVAHAAIVVITNGGQTGLSPMNAAAFLEPFGVPTLQVGSDHADVLNAQARRGGDVRVVAHAVRTPSTAHNVVARVSGSDARLAPVVVMTPRSGWFHCAAERGGGIACWLEVIRAVHAARPVRTVRFVASSGHELGHLGLDAFLHRNQELIKGAAAWLHLGANIGAARGRTRLQASDDEIEAWALEALKGARTGVSDRVPRGRVPGGEARNIHVAGGRYVSLLGNSPYFHHIADRWPVSVDAPAVDRYAAAMAMLVTRLGS
ncbi:MAG: hypothetical protein ACT4QD_01815 [Acidobacteriota bacterium]